MNSRLITPPTELAVSLSAARLALRYEDDETAFDPIIEAHLRGITDFAEGVTGRAFMKQTWRSEFASFGGFLTLYRVPLIQILSIKYLDPSGVEQVLPADSYFVAQNDCQAFVMPKTVWPDTLVRSPELANIAGVVFVEYEVGYGVTAASTPPAIANYIIAKLVEQFDSSNKDVSQIQASYLEGLLDLYRTYA